MKSLLRYSIGLLSLGLMLTFVGAVSVQAQTDKDIIEIRSQVAAINKGAAKYKKVTKDVDDVSLEGVRKVDRAENADIAVAARISESGVLGVVQTAEGGPDDLRLKYTGRNRVVKEMNVVCYKSFPSVVACIRHYGPNHGP